MIYASLSSVLFIAAIIVVSQKMTMLHITVNKNFISYINLLIMVAAMAFVIEFVYFFRVILNLMNDKKLLSFEQDEKNQEIKINK